MHVLLFFLHIFFFKQKTAYEMRISDWSSDVCSSDLPPFRYLCKQQGADLMYTEFISSEGLIRDAAKSRKKLDVFASERPIGIQIFGSDIDHMREATELAAAASTDLIDLN